MNSEFKQDVFISYSRKDTKVADKICHAFDKVGISYFIDRQGIGGGMEFPAVLARGIRESKVFLFLASKNSYDSKFTQSEIVYAFNKKQKQDIIPYIIDESKLPEALEFTFSAINWRRMELHPIETVLVNDILEKTGKEKVVRTPPMDILDKELSKDDSNKTSTNFFSYVSNQKWSFTVLAISLLLLIFSFIPSVRSFLFFAISLFVFLVILIAMIVGLFRPSRIQLKSRQEVICFYLSSLVFVFASMMVSASYVHDIIGHQSSAITSDTLPMDVKAIDLGLPSGTKWANMNVGAVTPEKDGNYYSWGETDAKEIYNHVSYKYSTGMDNGHGWYDSDNHYQDLGSDIGGSNFDVAYVKWGGDWKIPSSNQFEELIANCSYEWLYLPGYSGGKFTSKINGNSIFFPAAGYKSFNSPNSGTLGSYWTSTQKPDDSKSTLTFAFSPYDDEASISDCERWVGLSVRPVTQ